MIEENIKDDSRSQIFKHLFSDTKCFDLYGTPSFVVFGKTLHWN